jgi:hypothetical protein
MKKNLVISWWWRKGVHLCKIQAHSDADILGTAQETTNTHWHATCILQLVRMHVMLKHLLTCEKKMHMISNSLVQGPFWDTSGYSSSREISIILWNSNVLYNVQNSPPFFYLEPDESSPHPQILLQDLSQHFILQSQSFERHNLIWRSINLIVLFTVKLSPPCYQFI